MDAPKNVVDKLASLSMDPKELFEMANTLDSIYESNTNEEKAKAEWSDYILKNKPEYADIFDVVTTRRDKEITAPEISLTDEQISKLLNIGDPYDYRDQNHWMNLPVSTLMEKFGANRETLPAILRTLSDRQTARDRIKISEGYDPVSNERGAFDVLQSGARQILIPRTMEGVQLGSSDLTKDLALDIGENVIQAVPFTRVFGAIPRIQKLGRTGNTAKRMAEGVVSNATAPAITEVVDAAAYNADERPYRGTLEPGAIAMGTATNIMAPKAIGGALALPSIVTGKSTGARKIAEAIAFDPQMTNRAVREIKLGKPFSETKLGQTDLDEKILGAIEEGKKARPNTGKLNAEKWRETLENASFYDEKQDRTERLAQIFEQYRNDPKELARQIEQFNVKNPERAFPTQYLTEEQRKQWGVTPDYKNFAVVVDEGTPAIGSEHGFAATTSPEYSFESLFENEKYKPGRKGVHYPSRETGADVLAENKMKDPTVGMAVRHGYSMTKGLGPVMLKGFATNKAGKTEWGKRLLGVDLTDYRIDEQKLLEYLNDESLTRQWDEGKFKPREGTDMYEAWRIYQKIKKGE